MGPFLLFDKSFLQSLSLDEAVILDQMFSCIISPLFFSETMADLSKDAKGSRSTEQLVGELAARTPVAHSYMNAFHGRIVLEELLGDRAPMDRRPMVAGGIPVRHDDQVGIVYKKSVEIDAFERWQRGQFLDVERIAAKAWRASLKDLDLAEIGLSFKTMLRKEVRPRNHTEAAALANAIVDAPGQNYKTLLIAHHLLGVLPWALRDIVRAWKAAGSLPLRLYAPFTAQCLAIDLYFYLALSNGLISDQRPSNRIDIAYLYYLPVANVFVSCDRLHRASAPLFLHDDQQFIWGPDLKSDLANLNAAFLALPDDEKAKGLFILANRPPVDAGGLCADVWDHFRQGWREAKPIVPALTQEQHDDIITRGNGLMAAAKRYQGGAPLRAPPEDQLNHLIIERHIPRMRGSWRMFAREVEEADDRQ